MDKKSFALIIIILAATFGVVTTIRHYQPDVDADVDLQSIPLQIGEWTGTKHDVADYVLDMLRPSDYFSATYTNPRGLRVSVLVHFYAPDSGGGPHSPRHCLPGGGWQISNAAARPVDADGRIIPAGRFNLTSGNGRSIMDFWYVTNYGETANDYTFKLYEMLSAITFRPRFVGFVRFVTSNDPESVRALDEFQKLVVPLIYEKLPFG
jgi:EpsI family protein